MRYLGLDLGTKTLGIAISDPNGIIASPLKTLKYNNYDEILAELKTIIKEKQIAVIVLGLPKNMNNTIGTRAEETLAFKQRLEADLKMKIILEDERLTSKVANDILIDANISRKQRKKVVDKIAANIILQTYLDRKKGK
ncbi:MAG: Holliday junction resolvase RuvX [Bacilli bacterium]|jgi:putative Holliday junction resolvase